MMKYCVLPMKTEKEYLELIAEKISGAKKILVVGHKGPDFDSAGSCFGLSMVLSEMDKEAVTVVGNLPAKLKHSFGVAKVPEDRDVSLFKPDLVILLDYGAVRMLNQDIVEKIAREKPYVITIDHHVLEDQFGDIVWTDDDKTSASEMVFDVLEHMGHAISPEIGYCLLLGILSDTGEFVYYLRSERLMQKINRMNVSGRNLSLAFKVVRSWDSLEQFLLLGKIAAHLKIDSELGFAYVVVRKSGELSGIRSFLANQLLFIDNLKCVLVLQKMAGKNGYRGSMRSSALESTINVAAIASQFVGGGHVNSSAFNSHLSSVKIINTIKRLIREQLKEESGTDSKT